MSGNRAPALVSSHDDFVTYHVSDASAVDPNAPKGYIERYIHSEMYKRYSTVQCVVHAHAPDVLPYAISGVPLKPMFHMPAFLSTQVPIWDIETVYNETDQHDMLVRNVRQGASLAAKFADSANQTDGSSSTPDNEVVLMRKHGFTTHGPDIQTAVFQAVFTTVNAKVQTDSLLLRNAFGNMVGGTLDAAVWGGADGGLFSNAIEPLTERQAKDTAESIGATTGRPWELWVAEVEASPLYKNNE